MSIIRLPNTVYSIVLKRDREKGVNVFRFELTISQPIALFACICFLASERHETRRLDVGRRDGNSKDTVAIRRQYSATEGDDKHKTHRRLYPFGAFLLAVVVLHVEAILTQVREACASLTQFRESCASSVACASVWGTETAPFVFVCKAV